LLTFSSKYFLFQLKNAKIKIQKIMFAPEQKLNSLGMGDDGEGEGRMTTACGK
jgi:hypothetical protein